MTNKVILLFEDGNYNVCINGTIIATEKDSDKAYEKFKEVIADNKANGENNWVGILESLKDIKDQRLEINNDYKTINFGNMKYFHATGKIFYISNGQMQPLTGGIHTFKGILTMTTSGYIDNYEDLLKFCTDVLNNKATVRMTDTSIIVGSAAFNYGSAEYNFFSKKINKGASIESGNFDIYRTYVLNILKA
ncbi:hypothetical protein ACQPU1_08785 [Clostridium paraputrificum]|uniref:hypothetical protein n=1 Tax=Clostridium TaxID=1485 RepID=UPI003D34FA09